VSAAHDTLGITFVPTEESFRTDAPACLDGRAQNIATERRNADDLERTPIRAYGR